MSLISGPNAMHPRRIGEGSSDAVSRQWLVGTLKLMLAQPRGLSDVKPPLLLLLLPPPLLCTAALSFRRPLCAGAQLQTSTGIDCDACTAV